MRRTAAAAAYNVTGDAVRCYSALRSYWWSLFVVFSRQEKFSVVVIVTAASFSRFAGRRCMADRLTDRHTALRYHRSPYSPRLIKFFVTRSSAIAGKSPDAYARRCCYTVMSCRLRNDCDLLYGFSDFSLLFSYLTPLMRRILSSYHVHLLYCKTRMAKLQFNDGRMMIDSVAWAQYINVSDTQTATSP